jgi:spore maturation protein B
VKSCGADSYAAQLAGTILGGTETTLYVLAVYFGSVAIRRGRHALAAGLLADAAGVIASLAICRLVFK